MALAKRPHPARAHHPHICRLTEPIVNFADLHYPVDVSWTEVRGMRIAHAALGEGGVPLVPVHGLGGYIPT